MQWEFVCIGRVKPNRSSATLCEAKQAVEMLQDESGRAQQDGEKNEAGNHLKGPSSHLICNKCLTSSNKKLLVTSAYY